MRSYRTFPPVGPITPTRGSQSNGGKKRRSYARDCIGGSASRELGQAETLRRHEITNSNELS
jgi:hypothetical protein